MISREFLGTIYEEHRRKIEVAVCVLVAVVLWFIFWVPAPDVQNLTSQLRGDHCDYYFLPRFQVSYCEKRRLFFDPPPSRGLCEIWASGCLELMGEAARPALPELRKILKRGPLSDQPFKSPSIDNPYRWFNIPYNVLKIGGKAELPLVIDSLERDCLEHTPEGLTLKHRLSAILPLIGSFGPDAAEAIPLLLLHLEKGTGPGVTWIQEAATDALREIGPEKALPEILEALKKPDTAAMAASLLKDAGIGAKAAIPYMKKVLEEPSPESQVKSFNALIDRVFLVLVGRDTRLTHEDLEEIAAAQSAIRESLKDPVLAENVAAYPDLAHYVKKAQVNISEIRCSRSCASFVRNLTRTLPKEFKKQVFEKHKVFSEALPAIEAIKE